jgi:hypothetical protein
MSRICPSPWLLLALTASAATIASAIPSAAARTFSSGSPTADEILLNASPVSSLEIRSTKLTATVTPLRPARQRARQFLESSLFLVTHEGAADE